MLIILPTYNEADSLAAVVTRLLRVVPDAAVLIIDDASPDGTGRIADMLAADHAAVEVLHRPAKLGLGTAYVEGFRRALARGTRWVVQLDSDGSHLPEQLPELLEAARGGAGLALGARWVPGGRLEGWPRYRRFISRTGTRVARIWLRSRLHDITSGFRVFDSRWVAKLPLEHVASHGYSFQVEVAWALERLGCPIAEVPITFVERRAGHSKMTIRIVLEALVLVLRWGVRLRFGRSAHTPRDPRTPHTLRDPRTPHTPRDPRNPHDPYTPHAPRTPHTPHDPHTPHTH